jgi:DNA-binding NarL/FixJ family response regulator
VVVVDDHYLAREGMLGTLGMLTDIRLPPTYSNEGLQLAAELRRTHPGVAVLVLSQHAEPPHAVELLADGHARRGYLEVVP